MAEDKDNLSNSEFCSATNIVASLNEKYKLNGEKKLSKTTLYRAVRQGRVGESPMKRGPAPKIPEILLDVCASHTEVSQVGEGGELRGRDIKRLINAAVLGTRYEKSFAIDSVWKKLRTRHPESMQAGTKVSMEEVRSKLTTVNNLEQWFDDAKADLIKTGLVLDHKVRDLEGV